MDKLNPEVRAGVGVGEWERGRSPSLSVFGGECLRYRELASAAKALTRCKPIKILQNSFSPNLLLVVWGLKLPVVIFEKML